MKKNNFKLYATVFAILLAIIAVFVIVALVTGLSVADMFADFSDANGILIGICIVAILGGLLWLILTPDKATGKWQPQQLVIGALCLALHLLGEAQTFAG